MIRLTIFVLLFLAAMLLLPSIPAIANESRQPNVVVILADDQGWGDLSLHGNTNLSTPHIDSLGKEGIAFDRFFACPLCAPTRAEFLTGRYHARGGVTGVTMGQERLNLNETTIADAFLAAGYSTALFGKWHNGSQYPYHPNGRGFQEFYGFTSGHWGSYFNPLLEHNGKIVRGNGFLPDDLTDQVLKFIETNQEKPFFCYLALNTPHSPFQVPDQYWNKFVDHPLPLRGRIDREEQLDETRCALAMCENIDWNIGRILQQLSALHLDSDTIIIYMSDNGPNGWRWNDDMKGRKGQVDEGGVRVPCFLRWKGTLPAGKKITQIAGMIDLLPTLTQLTQVKRIGDLPLDGVDLSPLLLGTNESWPDRTIVSQTNKQLSVRSQRFRLAPNYALFDMQEDPGQRVDVAKKFPKEHQFLTAALTEWKESVQFDNPTPLKPIPVGCSAFPWTPLPARDATFSGQISRSASAPNCSYLTNWTSLEDRVTWELDIQQSGTYDVIIHYTCPESDCGSTIELRCEEQAVRGTIKEPFDSPLEDQSDRVLRRGESYIKDFKEWQFGRLSLPAGLHRLELSALQIAGKQIADLRGISLTLSKIEP